MNRNRRFWKAVLPVCAVCVLCLSACSTVQGPQEAEPATQLSTASDSNPVILWSSPRSTADEAGADRDAPSAAQQTLCFTDKGWVVSEPGAGEAQEAADAEVLGQIAPGMRLEEIRSLDPDADYDFLYASWTEYPRISHHHTADGRELSFYYDAALCLERVELS